MKNIVLETMSFTNIYILNNLLHYFLSIFYISMNLNNRETFVNLHQ